jgi:hypothetical protein
MLFSPCYCDTGFFIIQFQFSLVIQIVIHGNTRLNSNFQEMEKNNFKIVWIITYIVLYLSKQKTKHYGRF